MNWRFWRKPKLVRNPGVGDPMPLPKALDMGVSALRDRSTSYKIGGRDSIIPEYRESCERIAAECDAAINTLELARVVAIGNGDAS